MKADVNSFLGFVETIGEKRAKNVSVLTWLLNYNINFNLSSSGVIFIKVKALAVISEQHMTIYRALLQQFKESYYDDNYFTEKIRSSKTVMSL